MLEDSLNSLHKIGTCRIGKFVSAFRRGIRADFDCVANILVGLRMFPGNSPSPNNSNIHQNNSVNKPVLKAQS
jgi:hypothetical protein